MAQTRSRSPSDTEGPPTKRRRRSGSFSSEISDASPYFATNLLSDSSTQLHSEQYHSAQPFKHVVIDKIFQESLLTKVKDEILGHISFSEKETDIYKVSLWFFFIVCTLAFGATLGSLILIIFL